jgi:hypothetical protein
MDVFNVTGGFNIIKRQIRDYETAVEQGSCQEVSEDHSIEMIRSSIKNIWIVSDGLESTQRTCMKLLSKLDGLPRFLYKQLASYAETAGPLTDIEVKKIGKLLFQNRALFSSKGLDRLEPSESFVFLKSMVHDQIKPKNPLL